MAREQRSAPSTPRRSSTQGLPEDRFDRAPKGGRVGSHRFEARPRRFWYYLLAGVIATAVLVTAGIIGIQNIGGTKPGGGAGVAGGGSAQPQTPAELDPTATVAVLNGTTTPNLAAGVDQVITEQGWGQIAFSSNAAQSDVQISAVFYLDDADLSAAEGLAAKLGGVSAYKTDQYAEYGVRLIVLLGADYAGPGKDEAAALTAQGAEEQSPADVELPPADEQTSGE